ncbi:MAG: transcriptional repressor LexA [Gammaproteobacteria bacterium]|nr:transcriptional repressor LexA [Gammaproteobacteria bacterium]
MLSNREQDALAFIRDFIGLHGHAPLLNEIAAGLGIHSKGTVHRYVQTLARDGHITLFPGRHRGITLNTDQQDAPWVLPLLGRIAAGRPIEAIPGHDTLNLAEFFMGPDRFVLRVSGDSMIDAGILDGDMVIIKRCERANDGAIIVALIDGEQATLKRLRRGKDGSVTLLAENRSYPPMIYPADRVRIQGIVVGQLRSYQQ